MIGGGSLLRNRLKKKSKNQKIQKSKNQKIKKLKNQKIKTKLKTMILQIVYGFVFLLLFSDYIVALVFVCFVVATHIIENTRWYLFLCSLLAIAAWVTFVLLEQSSQQPGHQQYKNCTLF